LWWPSLTKDMQTEQLLCWSGMTDTEHSTSGSNKKDKENNQPDIKCLLDWINFSMGSILNNISRSISFSTIPKSVSHKSYQLYRFVDVVFCCGRETFKYHMTIFWGILDPFPHMTVFWRFQPTSFPIRRFQPTPYPHIYSQIQQD